MRKIVRILAAVIVMSVATMCFAACSEKEFTAVAIGPGHYAGSARVPTVIEATVTVDASGTVLDIKFDEIFSPLDAATPQGTPAVEEGYIVSIGGAFYYEYLSIGGEIFTVVNNEDVFGGYTGKVNGVTKVLGATADATEKKNDFLNTDAGAKWYYDAYKAGTLFYARKTGEATPVATSKKFETRNNASTDSMRKRDSGYWAAGGNGLGIMANYDALEKYFLNNGFDNAKAAWTIPATGTTGTEKIIKDTAGVSTGATMTDTNLYVKVARAAYNDAVAKSK